MSRRNIFNDDFNEIKSFEGKTVGDFLSAYKEQYSNYSLESDYKNELKGITFIYVNEMDDHSNKAKIYIHISINAVNFQNSNEEENKWDIAKIQKETISGISLLTLPRDEFAPLDSFLPN